MAPEQKRERIMKCLSTIGFAVITVFSSLTMAIEQQTLHASQLADRVMSEMHSWDNKKLKAFLQHRMSENQHLLGFLTEYHSQLEKTELDTAYNYFVKALIEDQKGLAFVGQNLNAIDSAEELQLDEFLQAKPGLNSEVNQVLANRVRMESSKAVVNRVLYYSLMDKYAIN